MVTKVRRIDRAPESSRDDDEDEKNVWVKASVHKRLKVHAASQGKSLKELAGEYLEWALDRAEKAGKSPVTK